MLRIVPTMCIVIALSLLAADFFLASPTVAQTPPASGSTNYVYDSIGRVVGETHPASSATYDYDAAENRVSAAQF